ncbi:hypothetical protein BC938DRAFT_471613 [Jimgerdemannia flammicorona]|uniref:Uncharacterized protein n=1 Tax=Jimgerdemannia flammicorona TaxID=994334 RepID=A0A433Q7M2_9FUNG|nr:hypothetical protein BC938DRAFT_471613 [Jimgerdemannia flammicorona]
MLNSFPPQLIPSSRKTTRQSSRHVSYHLVPLLSSPFLLPLPPPERIRTSQAPCDLPGFPPSPGTPTTVRLACARLAPLRTVRTPSQYHA